MVFLFTAICQTSMARGDVFSTEQYAVLSTFLNFSSLPASVKYLSYDSMERPYVNSSSKVSLMFSHGHTPPLWEIYNVSDERAVRESVVLYYVQ